MPILSTEKSTLNAPIPLPFLFDTTPHLSDYHTHTSASPDSEEKISNLCAAAVKAGLSEIAITDHYDCGNKECRDVIAASYPSIEYAISEFSPEIKIKKGIEIGQATQFPEDEEFVLKNYSFDFILGSIHNIRNHIDFYFMENESNPEELIKLYFDELIEMCEKCSFDVLAHLTYPLRYKAFINKIDLTLYDKQITRIFKLLAESGRGLEINTGGLRNPAFLKLSPTLELLKLYKSLGGEIITFGSDAHKAQDAAYGFDEALNAAKSAGFTRYAVYTNRVATLVNF